MVLQMKTGKRALFIDVGRCSHCGGCMEIAPEVFGFNEVTGLPEVYDCSAEKIVDVEEAMKNCPKDCIHWEVDVVRRIV